MAAMHAKEKIADNSILVGEGLKRQNSQKLKYSRNVRKGQFFDIAPYTKSSIYIIRNVTYRRLILFLLVYNTAPTQHHPTFAALDLSMDKDLKPVYSMVGTHHWDLGRG